MEKILLKLEKELKTNNKTMNLREIEDQFIEFKLKCKDNKNQELEARIRKFELALQQEKAKNLEFRMQTPSEKIIEMTNIHDNTITETKKIQQTLEKIGQTDTNIMTELKSQGETLNNLHNYAIDIVETSKPAKCNLKKLSKEMRTNVCIKLLLPLILLLSGMIICWKVKVYRFLQEKYGV